MAGKKKRGIGWRTRALGAVLLVVLVATGWGWWRLQHWTPAAAKYPDQGAEIGAADGAVRFDTLKALGARFVYLDASDGARRSAPPTARCGSIR